MQIVSGLACLSSLVVVVCCGREARGPVLLAPAPTVAPHLPAPIVSDSLRDASAMGSMRETLSCIEVGVALGYVGEIDAGLRGRIDHVLGTLFKLV